MNLRIKSKQWNSNNPKNIECKNAGKGDITEKTVNRRSPCRDNSNTGVSK